MKKNKTTSNPSRILETEVLKIYCTAFMLWAVLTD